MRQLTVVIPTYNEADTVNRELGCAAGPLAESLNSILEGGIKVIHRPGKLGLGSAYRRGFEEALNDGSEAIGQMDADFSHSPSYLPPFLSELDHYDAVFGSRWTEGGSVDERWSVGRVFLSRFGNTYARVILGLKVKDSTGGFRFWRSEALAAMPLERNHSEGYVFQVEMAYVAQRIGHQILEQPIYFEDRRIGQSKMSLRIQIEAALRVWMLRYTYRDL